ncbi:MAG: hypothetical protein NTX91_05945, partial [candidate division SR1 bacterium]|nr:hypothetical protein [candidate division SR1 bacterium]
LGKYLNIYFNTNTMFKFLRDLVIYPFKPSPDNRFGQFLHLLFRNFPAFFWLKQNAKKIILLPLLTLHNIFKK